MKSTTRHALSAVAAEAESCQRCPLWERATQTVFGEGPVPARLMLVGEQPGDREDVEGKPFVGPAGRILDEGLEAAGIERTDLYLTNAVKHFKWKPAPRGKRRIHDTPNRTEVVACHPWLVSEVELVDPELIVALGSVAARAVAGRPVKVLAERGLIAESEFGVPFLTTVHPSSIVRIREAPERQAAMDAFVADLEKARPG